jgi:hypothetical protein
MYPLPLTLGSRIRTIYPSHLNNQNSYAMQLTSKSLSTTQGAQFVSSGTYFHLFPLYSLHLRWTRMMTKRNFLFMQNKTQTYSFSAYINFNSNFSRQQNIRPYLNPREKNQKNLSKSLV